MPFIVCKRWFLTTEQDISINGTGPEQLPLDSDIQGTEDNSYFQDTVEETAAPVDTGTGDEISSAPAAEAPPADIPAPQPAAPAQSNVIGETELLRQQLQDRERQLQQIAFEQQRNMLQQEARSRAEQLESQGLLPEQATQIANEQLQMREREMQAQQQLQSQGVYMQGKMNAALHYSEKHRVSAQSLMQYDTPQAMEMAALNHSKITALEQEVAALRKRAVPSQSMDTNQASPVAGSTYERLLNSALAKHSSERTESERAALARAAGM